MGRRSRVKRKLRKERRERELQEAAENKKEAKEQFYFGLFALFVFFVFWYMRFTLEPGSRIYYKLNDSLLIGSLMIILGTGFRKYFFVTAHSSLMKLLHHGWSCVDFEDKWNIIYYINFYIALISLIIVDTSFFFGPGLSISGVVGVLFYQILRNFFAR